MGRDLPEFPTIFYKISEAHIGAGDEIRKPVESDAFDWECELAVIIGTPTESSNGVPSRGRRAAGRRIALGKH